MTEVYNLLDSFYLVFLYIGFIIENFKWSWKIPDKIDLLQI
jgi:hypothetical protein